jgi:hypothetical protein
MMGSSAGATEVNVSCTDSSESNEQREGESDDEQEYRLVRQGVSNQAHESGCEKTSRRGKALIAPKPFRQGRMTDQTKTDRSDRRSE